MPDCVLDTTVVALANGDLAARQPGNAFDRRLRAIEQVVTGVRRLRYNTKILGEYQRLVRQYRNDVIEMLFLILDSDRSVLVRRSTLSRQEYAAAVKQCGWPSHDQHLLAAALGGVDPAIVVTELHLGQCASKIFRLFAVHVEYIG